MDQGVRRFRHLLIQALGAREGSLKPEVHRLLLSDGHQLLPCSDGLTEMVDDETIAGDLQEPQSATRACQTLVDLALDQRGRDNVTVVVAHYLLPMET